MWYDLVVIGGGINGCGIAADAALRGLSVLLCEIDTLASKTSSKSSKLIHGGLRYLETYDFALVKKARDEQQLLLNIAPHLVHPCQFVLPHAEQIRALWQLRAGLFIYDHISRNNHLPHSRYIQSKTDIQYFTPLEEQYKQGFVFYDCTTDDVKLTKANALQAEKHGAHILTHISLIKAKILNNQWQLTFNAAEQEKILNINTQTVINATGPWLKNTAEILHTKLTHELSLIKGSHIIVPKLYEGEHAYILQHTDKRVIFVIPYKDCHLIGTTDIPYTGNLNDVTIDSTEIDYLCNIINNYFKKKVSPHDYIDSWSGVRPLVAQTGHSASNLSRDYHLEYTTAPAPVVTVYGGKLTTYRKLALEAVDLLKPIFPNLAASKTAYTTLP